MRRRRREIQGEVCNVAKHVHAARGVKERVSNSRRAPKRCALGRVTETCSGKSLIFAILGLWKIYGRRNSK